MTLVSLFATLVFVFQGPVSTIEGTVGKSGSGEGLAQSQITLVRTNRPGNYKLFAWEDLEPNAYYDEEILKRYESQGRAVIVREAGKVQVELKPIQN